MLDFLTCRLDRHRNFGVPNQFPVKNRDEIVTNIQKYNNQKNCFLSICEYDIENNVFPLWFLMDFDSKNPEDLNEVEEDVANALNWLEENDISYQLDFSGCLSEDTEVLTENGWKNGIDLKNEKIASFNPLTSEISFEYPFSIFKSDYNGDLILLENKNGTSQLLTSEHRILVERWIPKEKKWNRKFIQPRSIYGRDKLILSGNHSGKGLNNIDFARLLGWIITEGSFSRNRPEIRISQTDANPAFVKEIRGLLDKLHIKFREYSYKREGYEVEFDFQFGGTWNRAIRNLLPNKLPTYKLLFTMTLSEKIACRDSMLKGDGTKAGEFFRSFAAKSEYLRKWFQTLCHLTSFRAHLGKKEVSISKKYWTALQHCQPRFKTKRYRGKIWDVSIPNGAFLVRRNDKIFVTGNSKGYHILIPLNQDYTYINKDFKLFHSFIVNLLNLKTLDPTCAETKRLCRISETIHSISGKLCCTLLKHEGVPLNLFDYIENIEYKNDDSEYKCGDYKYSIGTSRFIFPFDTNFEMPCIFEELKQGETSHKSRWMWVKLMQFKGYSLREIFDLAKKFHWNDFNPNITSYQISYTLSNNYTIKCSNDICKSNCKLRKNIKDK